MASEATPHPEGGAQQGSGDDTAAVVLARIDADDYAGAARELVGRGWTLSDLVLHADWTAIDLERLADEYRRAACEREPAPCVPAAEAPREATPHPEGRAQRGSKHLGSQRKAPAHGTEPQPVEDVGKAPSTSESLVRLALERYRLGRSETDEPFAETTNGPRIALMFRGSARALRATLTREYRAVYSRTPSASALADALTALEGEALDCPHEPVYLRVAPHGDGVVLDLGDPAGRAVVVKPGAWQLVERSPVLFRRTALTDPLPVPHCGGDLAELRELVHLDDEGWALVEGWMVAALREAPCPILLFGGPQGAGKSTAARMVARLIDPSPANLRTPPEGPRDWVVSASASWVVPIDNVSTIVPWWSDALCRAVTGDGWVPRSLFTDSDVAVLFFRRPIVLTSIDAGALRGDLGDRLLLVDLAPIAERERRTDAELRAAYEAMRPRLLGALLDRLAAVLAVLPGVHLDRLPRMADFGAVLAALDRLDGVDGRRLPVYLDQRVRVAETILDSDPVAGSILALVESGPWEGTAGELLARLTPERPARGWPASARGMAGRLLRLVTALAEVGIVVEYARASDRSRRRTWRIAREDKGDEPSRPSDPSGARTGASAEADPVWTVADDPGRSPPADRPALIGRVAAVDGVADGSDGSDGRAPALSAAELRLLDGLTPAELERVAAAKRIFGAEIMGVSQQDDAGTCTTPHAGAR